jgi:outer membrane protein insertion porin family
LDAIILRNAASLRVFFQEMDLRAIPARDLATFRRFGVVPVCLLLMLCVVTGGWSQVTEKSRNAHGANSSGFPEEENKSSLAEFEGLPVRRIEFKGVSPERLAPLQDHLAVTIGSPISEDTLAESLRQVFATGLFETVAVDGVREGDGVALLFNGRPRVFVGTVTVYGAKGASVNSQLESASRLLPGTRFTEARLEQALTLMRQTLADDGYHAPTIDSHLTPHKNAQLVDLEFRVVSGPQARVGGVEVAGEPGMSVDEFRHVAHLKAGNRVDHDTVNRALNGVLKHYQKQDRLEAEIKVVSQNYDASTNRISYQFSATFGPIVKIRIEGANISSERLKHAIPVYEEGTVDEDLLNEGNRRLRDYYQRLGYFDVKVDHERQTPSPNEVIIAYIVTLGQRRRVDSVSVSGNRYFDSSTLKDLLSVRAANTIDRHGIYSQALVVADVSALQAVYQNNGFSHVRITPSAVAVDVESERPVRASRKPAGLAVEYRIDEGQQQRVGAVTLDGNNHAETGKLLSLMNTAPGQLFSPQNLAGDRDALMTDYLSRGFDQVSVDVEEHPDPSNASAVDIVFHITEGKQTFVRNVYVTGLHYTRPDTVKRAITLRDGDPLSQPSLLQTQRNLYDFALFTQVNTAIENPSGESMRKTVLVQLSEARRWTFTYGFGFEAQTGTPQNNCAGYEAVGIQCSPGGRTGISPRVLGALTRNNLFGREQSASIQGTYGLLEQSINLIFQNPHLSNPNFGLNFTGGYANSLAVTTYVASKLDAGFRLTEHFNFPESLLSRANTLVYAFDFRRVKVAESSLQVYPTGISALSAAVRVAGPGLTWIRDTRDSPIDSHRGTYTSFQGFASGHPFGSEAQFNRLDLTNSSYYGFNRNRLVLARNSRYAQERAFGEESDRLIPLPERLYAGGPTSLRGFSINAAGPRDPETGYPIGGAGALANSTELRLPPPTLPWVGDSVSFVLFHDMGNVFTNAGDAWASALRIHQPDRDNCKILTQGSVENPPIPPGPNTSTGPLGYCSFNYFSHAAGLGMRYHTPVGPIRLDFSYNLNPPIYPVNVNYSLTQPYSEPHVGEANHFNFFFSLGQTF